MYGQDNPSFDHGSDDPVQGETNIDKQQNAKMERVVIGQEETTPGEIPLENRNSYTISITEQVDLPPYSEEADQEDYSLFSLIPGLGLFLDLKKSLSDPKTKKWITRLILSVIALLYTAYFIAVLFITTDIEKDDYWCSGDGLLIVITGIVVFGLFYFQIVKPFFGEFLYNNLLEPLGNLCGKIWGNRPIRLIVYASLVILTVVFLIMDTWDEPRRLISVLGIVVLLLFGFLFSVAPRKVRWRHVIWGMGLQFILGLIILRWSVGKAVFECAGSKVSAFLAFTDHGSGFVFGDLVKTMGIFAFKVLSVILFFSFCIQILYYWGVMQWVVIKLGWFLQVTIGTTACESVNAAANIFLGQTEAPLLIKPFIPIMTKSELHAVMTGGFATIAGSVLAAYISFGVDPSHLLSASVMSAPAALAFAKLFYPETKVSRTGVNDIRIEKGTEANVLHAAMVGVTNSIPLVANIAANLIAFYAFIAFLSQVLDWGCTLAGKTPGQCSLEGLFGWFFMPLAWVMGVDWSECDKVGELIGIKTIINEFVAYNTLSGMKGQLSKRAQIIATYALCGFSNISSIGINLGGFGAMAPERKGDLASVVVRAMIAGSCACFLTACVAGTLLSGTDVSIPTNVTAITDLVDNVTTVSTL